MNFLPQPYENTFMLFFFVYVRVSAAVFVMPIFSNTMVSRPIRAGIAFWIAVVVLGPTWGLHESLTGYDIPAVTEVYQGLLDFAIAVLAEFAIGFTLGFLGQLFLQTIGLAGEIIGQQAGFSAASVFDPITGQDIFLMAQLNTLFGTLVFLAINGPESIISIVVDSFYVLHPGEGFLLSDFTKSAYDTFLYDEGRRYAMASILYKMGVQIAAPIIASMVLISIAEAFIARAVPQLNILVIGFAVRISMSLIILLSAMPFIINAFSRYLHQYSKYATAFLYNMISS